MNEACLWAARIKGDKERRKRKETWRAFNNSIVGSFWFSYLLLEEEVAVGITCKINSNWVRKQEKQLYVCVSGWGAPQKMFGHPLAQRMRHALWFSNMHVWLYHLNKERWVENLGKVLRQAVQVESRNPICLRSTFWCLLFKKRRRSRSCSRRSLGPSK